MPLPLPYINWKFVPQPGDKPRKVPCDPVTGRNIVHLDPVNWVDEATARSRISGDIHVGVVLPRLNESEPYAPFLLDLDGAVDTTTDTPKAWAADLLARFPDARIERSHSGTGFHVMGYLQPSAMGTNRRSKFAWLDSGANKVECYWHSRFVALGKGATGNFNLDWTAQLAEIVPEKSLQMPAPTTGVAVTGPAPDYNGPTDDSSLLDLIRDDLNRNGGALAVGLRAAHFFGDPTAFHERALVQYGQDSAKQRPWDFDCSSADMALMNHLAYYTGCDVGRMVRLHGSSIMGQRQKARDRPGYVLDTARNAATRKLAAGQYLRDKTLPATAERASTFFAASDLAQMRPPPRDWHVPELVPGGTVTLLGGDGGTGKSLVALQLAVATATGGEWLGMKARAGHALYISAEDDTDELHRRLHSVAEAQGVSLTHFERLTVRSLAGEDALLALADRHGVLYPTALLQEIEARIAMEQPALIVLDTLADLFPGNENDRAQARQFIGMLRGLAIRNGCAVVLLAHPSLSGMASGVGTSGSTAWNNSVRSRLYLERVREEGRELDPDMRVLRSMKANYAATGGEIYVRWNKGIFTPLAGRSGLSDDMRHAKAEHVFLKLLEEFAAEGRAVRSAQANGYAPKAFAKSHRAEGLNKNDFADAMERLFAKGEIQEVLGGHSAPSRQNKRIVRKSKTPHNGAC